MDNWDYAVLAKQAKEAGGPEAFLEFIKDSARDDGVSQGISQGRKEGAIATGIIGLMVCLGYKVCRKFLKKEEKYPKEAVKIAETELINGIRDYDKNHEDNNFADSMNTEVDNDKAGYYKEEEHE